MIRSRSATKKLHSHSQEKYQADSNMLKTSKSSSPESVEVTGKDNLSLPLDELENEETDVSDTLSNRSFGILPGIPSHDIRER